MTTSHSLTSPLGDESLTLCKHQLMRAKMSGNGMTTSRDFLLWDTQVEPKVWEYPVTSLSASSFFFSPWLRLCLISSSTLSSCWQHLLIWAVTGYYTYVVIFQTRFRYSTLGFGNQWVISKIVWKIFSICILNYCHNAYKFTQLHLSHSMCWSVLQMLFVKRLCQPSLKWSHLWGGTKAMLRIRYPSLHSSSRQKVKNYCTVPR